MKTELALRTLSALVLGVAVLFITYWHPTSFATLCLLGAIILWKEWRGLTRGRGLAWGIGGLLYIGAAMLSLIALRYQANGMHIIFLLLILVWAGDIGAYAVGKLIGKHKIAPSISPGKSWEGLAGAVLATSGVLYFLTLFGPQIWPWYFYAGIGALVSCLGLAGDLFESKLKRRAGVKDSGKLIPGHGGLFDRVDALLPVALLFAGIYFLLPMAGA